MPSERHAALLGLLLPGLGCSWSFHLVTSAADVVVSWFASLVLVPYGYFFAETRPRTDGSAD